GRSGMRVGDILLPDFFKRYSAAVDRHRKIIGFLGGQLDIEAQEKEFFAAVEYLRTLNLVDSEYMINEAIKGGKKILAEGAQGSL
uniref:adenylosuccinate synthetase n=1 Tax=Salmonella sp. SAL4448 TaxID=3159903 RepID=UPI00397CBC41